MKEEAVTITQTFDWLSKCRSGMTLVSKAGHSGCLSTSKMNSKSGTCSLIKQEHRYPWLVWCSGNPIRLCQVCFDTGSGYLCLIWCSALSVYEFWIKMVGHVACIVHTPLPRCSAVWLFFWNKLPQKGTRSDDIITILERL